MSRNGTEVFDRVNEAHREARNAISDELDHAGEAAKQILVALRCGDIEFAEGVALMLGQECGVLPYGISELDSQLDRLLRGEPS